MSGYSPKANYKNILKQQKKLLSSFENQTDVTHAYHLTLVIQLSADYELNLKACIDSLIALHNEIDSLCFLHDAMFDKKNRNIEEFNNIERQTIQKKLAELLADSSLSYSTDSKENFINNVSNVSTDIFVWCQTPVIFYPTSFKALLNSYSVNESSASVIYCDHDILFNGQRISPAFKPELNLDWLLSSNYMGNVILFNKAKLVDKIESSPLFFCNDKIDLLHELLKIIATDSLCIIKHVPIVLYSELHTNKEAVVETITDTRVKRVNWPIPKNSPLVSIIIPTRNSKQLVQQCIESLYRFTHYDNFEVLLVDNESDDVASIEYFKQLERDNKVKLLNYDAVFNYSAINNFAVKYAKGDVLLFMNNDIEVLHENWLEEMVMHVIREDIGCVGAKLYYPNMTIQHAGVIVGLWGCAGHSHKHFKRTDHGYMNRLNVVQNYSAVTAACMAVRKTVFNDVKGFNEEDLTVSFNDVDLCLKIKEKGYRNLWTPYAEMIHHESISRGSEDTPEKKIREAKEIAYMQSTWHLNTKVDPAYSSWLTQEKEDFSLIIERR
ncbi:MAG: glycosyltransferase [Colwellia sp.]|nr:glycosyltransferase [Colwellia sp.]